MLLSTFLEYIIRTKQLPQGIVFCFSGGEYPLIFFYHLILFLKKNGLCIESLNCSSTDMMTIKKLLSTMSFSGTTIYYLENFVTLSAKKQQELFEYLRFYTGPYTVLLFTQNTSDVSSTSSESTIKHITFSEMLPSRDYPVIRSLVNDTIANKTTNFTCQLTARLDALSLDSACLLAHYELLIGKGIEEFFSQWMVRIIEPTSSLFILAQYFFGKKNKLFFKQWATMSDAYLPPFWANFWADQIWRAYVFCDLMKQKKYAEAKKAQYKLPFSFVNRDWSSYSATELRNAHHFLSNLDFKLKNGASEIGLEYFYLQFFNSKFR